MEKEKILSKFDAIIIFEVLEHLNDWGKFIIKLRSNLKKNGILIISPINKNLISKFLTIDIAENYLKWIPENTHTYHKFIKLVSNSRQMTIESVEELAQGRIWSGSAAVKNNLVDSLGVFQDGIDMLKEDSGIQDFEIEYIPTSPGILEGFWGSFNSFLETSLSFIGYIKPLEIQHILTKKRIDTNLICIVCPELN